MARSLQFNASWLHHESAGAPTRSAALSAPLPAAANAATLLPAPAPAPAPAAIPPATPEEPVTAVSAEQAVVIELLQIARTVLTLEITFLPGPPPPSPSPALPVPEGAARFDTPVVLRDGRVYGTLCCVSDDRRTPVGSRPADALRCVAVLVGKELDRHRRKAG
jgi:hypothetical protein